MWDRLTCVTPAAACVDLADAKVHLRVEHSDHDAMIARLVLAAQAVITGPRGTGYAIAASTWRLSLDTFPCRGEIRIPLEPVKSIVSIKYIDAAGVEQTLAEADYLVDVDTVPGRIAPAFGKTFPVTRAQMGAVKVLFIAGEAQAPTDLGQAVLLMVGNWYDNAGGSGAIPDAAESILDRYRDRAL